MSNFSILLSSELTEAIGCAIIHSLWQGCLIMTILMILHKIFKLSSSARYWSALIAMILLLLSSTFTLVHFLSSGSAISQINGSPLLILNNIEGIQEIEPLNFLEQYLPTITWIWAIGVIFFALKLCGGFVQIYRLKYQGIISIPDDWQKRFDDLLIKTRIGLSVQLWQSSKISAPMVLGYFKPVVLIPIGMISGLSTAQIEAILLHELSHIKRHDFLVNSLQSIIEVIYYYHPVVWWLSTQVRKEREHCCDDQIIAHGVDKMIYAQALTNVGTINFTQNKLTMGLANNKNDLLNRIKRLVEGQEHSSTNIYSKGIPLLVLITILMSFSWYQRQELPKEYEGNVASAELAAPEHLQEVPMFRTPLIDTVIIDKLPATSSRTSSKTSIKWTGDEGAVFEIIQDSDIDSDNNWEELEDHLNDTDIDMRDIIDELATLRDLDVVVDIDNDFDETFDFHFDGDLDTLPEVHFENIRRVEEELARVKESMNRIHFDFKEDSELTEEQKNKLKKEMRAMEMEIREKMELINNFELHDRNEREWSKNRDEYRDLRHREREMQQRELHLQREEFSMQRVEEKMRVMEQELQKREEEMEAWEKNYYTYQKALVKELKDDEYLGKGEKLKNFEMSNDEIKVNGKAIDLKDLKKYKELKSKYLDK